MIDQGEEVDPVCKIGFANNYFYVSEILKERTLKNGRKQLFVSWEGWPAEYNSWVYQETVMPVADLLHSVQSSQQSAQEECKVEPGRVSAIDQWRQYKIKKSLQKKRRKPSKRNKKSQIFQESQSNGYYSTFSHQTSETKTEGEIYANTNSCMGMRQKDCQIKKPKMDIKAAKKTRKKAEMITVSISVSSSGQKVEVPLTVEPKFAQQNLVEKEKQGEYLINLGDVSDMGNVSKVSIDSQMDSFIKMPSFMKDRKRPGQKYRPLTRSQSNRFSTQQQSKVICNNPTGNPKDKEQPKQLQNTQEVNEVGEKGKKVDQTSLLISNPFEVMKDKEKPGEEKIEEEDDNNLLLSNSICSAAALYHLESMKTGHEEPKDQTRTQMVKLQEQDNTFSSQKEQTRSPNEVSTNSAINRAFCESKQESKVENESSSQGPSHPSSKLEQQNLKEVQKGTLKHQESSSSYGSGTRLMPAKLPHRSQLRKKSTKQSPNRQKQLSSVGLRQIMSYENSNSIIYWEPALSSQASGSSSKEQAHSQKKGLARKPVQVKPKSRGK